ncbi:MAG: polysaccharide deacetylase family protein [Flavobacterium sp.]|jgi:peptidoglycan/xylan/chitin deacetylase (PgdA/CDA1 family)|uniref:polysaccharide deacetylase family protein n=1 Tax=Flavobacterium sp. TaxID=239 RepID=UPI0022BD0AC2|nr:polysaccharide deacetylase family protein [Flavobacterium sp.]MCZ8167744.1 polysaccharide deacetylase family protein [Flavobacterium sp.]MCZ8297607.1 polysaccharide deacetylase family protein [Flavobacterium sp.]
MMRWIKTPLWVKKLTPNLVWDIPQTERIVYLTFDDGPTPEITPWVLETLAAYHFKATFFLIGNNVAQFPNIAQSLIKEGHGIGNHTYHHRNSWNTSREAYLEDIKACTTCMETHLGRTPLLFRPPYGKLKLGQPRQLRGHHLTPIMWDILTYDWDINTTPEDCLKSITQHVQPGSIIVFHDSKKAFGNLKTVLPKALAYLKAQGYRGEILPKSDL